MGMNTKAEGWRIFCVDDDAVGPPMKATEQMRMDTRAIVMWRQKNFLRVDMRYGGTVDVNKYAGVCTTSISGCNALAIVKINGHVTECFFAHATADMTATFTDKGIDLLGGSLTDHHAVLVENYASSESNSQRVAEKLIAAGLPPAQFMVYTNPFRRSDQTFGVRFSDGLVGEVHVREATQALTAPLDANQFIQGFDSVPPKKSEYDLIAIYRDGALADTFMLLLHMNGQGANLAAVKFTMGDEAQKAIINDNGEKVIHAYLMKVATDPQFRDIKRLIQQVFKQQNFKFTSLN